VRPITVHNQCSDFELVSPVYFGHNAIWLKPPCQKVDANTIISASFGKNAFQREFESALIYKLQRKRSLVSGNQSGTNDTSIENSSTSLQLLVMWMPGYEFYKFYVRVILINHSDAITWNEDKLKELYSVHFELFKDYYYVKNTWSSGDRAMLMDTWLLGGTTVLMTTSKWNEESCVHEITISEGTREDNSIEPLLVSLSGIRLAKQSYY
jgi:hypothetical protein